MTFISSIDTEMQSKKEIQYLQIEKVSEKRIYHSNRCIAMKFWGDCQFTIKLASTEMKV